MFLKELESWLERGQNVPFLGEICPRKKCTPHIGADIGAITRILSKIPVDNGSSLNKLITLKINVLANKTVTKTSVSVV
jgi:hypothetical protein